MMDDLELDAVMDDALGGLDKSQGVLGKRKERSDEELGEEDDIADEDAISLDGSNFVNNNNPNKKRKFGEDDNDDDDMDMESDEDSVAQEELEQKDSKVNKQMKAILSKLTPDQTTRYEYFRRSTFQRAAIKRMMQTISGCSIGQRTVIVMAGITKLFVGEMVEMARTVMDEWGELGPIRPRHLHEAYRRLQKEGKVAYTTKKKQRLFLK
eukprot:TRINITY_DN3689_c0_g1_i1.p1 TRINITY_DN3689_c0_g1~~TRINITY_DN3689_c0_g1_i1.p1  ORF type:complete len:210 (+),score=56.00 TRINITY_DN3689_c0_g1_i1:39-668(+)